MTQRRILAFAIGFTLMWGVLGTRYVLGEDAGIVQRDSKGSIQFDSRAWGEGSIYGMPKAKEGECPADRPHHRTVSQYPRITTLVACMPRLVCGSARCAYETVQCNKPPQPVDVEICLSQEELEQAR